MNYGQPKQATDGRYFIKVNKLIQLDNVILDTLFSSSNDLTFTLPTKAQEQIKHVDSQNLVAAKENCSAWFKKELSDKTLNAAYTDSLKDGKDTMNITKATVKSQVVTKVFDFDKSLMSNDSEIQEGTKCDVIFEFSGLWFSKKTFGPMWKVVQLRLKSPPLKKYPDEYLFQEDASSSDGSESDFF
jgi:hypothetical protein